MVYTVLVVQHRSEVLMADLFAPLRRWWSPTVDEPVELYCCCSGALLDHGTKAYYLICSKCVGRKYKCVH